MESMQSGMQASETLMMFMDGHRMFVCLLIVLFVVGVVLIAEFVTRKRIAGAVDVAIEEEEKSWAEEYATMLTDELEKTTAQVTEQVTQQVTASVTASVTATFEQEKTAILAEIKNRDAYLQGLTQNMQQMQERLIQLDSLNNDTMNRLQEKDRLLTSLHKQSQYFANECEAYQQMVLTYDQALKDAERDKQFLLNKLEQFLSPEQLARLKEGASKKKRNKNTPPPPLPDEDWIPYSEVSPNNNQ